MRYPMEVYRAGATRVIWSHEEHLAVKAEGWMDEKPPANDPPAEDGQLTAGELMLRGMAKDVDRRKGRRAPSEVA